MHDTSGIQLLVRFSVTWFRLRRALVNSPKFTIARVPTLYVIGSIPANWSFGRIVSILA
jgi:hypothetical protein